MSNGSSSSQTTGDSEQPGDASVRTSATLIARIGTFVALCVSAVVIFFVGQLIASVFIGTGIGLLQSLGVDVSISELFDGSAHGISFVLFAYIGLVIVGLVFVALKMMGMSVLSAQKFLMLRRGIPLWAVVDVVLTFGMFFVATLLVNVLVGISGVVDVDQMQDIGFTSPENTSARILLFLTIAVVPAIWEEILFRGYLYNVLKKHVPGKWSTVAAYVCTSAIFGLAHIEGSSLNWIAAIDTGVFSLFLIYISQKYNSLYPAMLLHAFKNGLAFFVLFIVGL